MNDSSTYFIRGYRLAGDDGQLQSALQYIHGSAERARCMCVPGGVEMYVAKFHQFVLKRMPGTGPLHAPHCEHYDPPASESGLGVLLGDALIESTDEGVQMFVDFPLTRRRGRAIEPVGENCAPEVRAARHHMSLRAVTHYLLEQARFNRWSPAMDGKRNQGVFRKYVLEAADGVNVKNSPLVERLYIPEPYHPDDREQIRGRRRAQLALLERHGTPEEFPMALVMGEFKAAQEDTFGYRLMLKHMPDAPILIDEKLWAKTLKKFKPLFMVRQADGTPPSRILVSAIIYSPQPYCYQADAIFLTLATHQWIPLCDPCELPLLHHLVDRRRRFMKPLPYDAKEPALFPNVLLLDTGSVPTPLHVVSGFMTKRDRDAKERLKSHDGLPVWLWRAEESIPELPPPVPVHRYH
ncbi:DUF1173 family protein [Pseudoduganella buxea]|uniref:DUF1173 family protein n=1 Tax=Pseudoduganella buxea TaxID=1949069 RepID=A0A6I3SWH2_9BURK|nr:DUF1173 family protein [Pseudoduganella buxea]MTV53543.1 DUF1173 family protein [Pseudoduganella buxea]GGC22981.1 hypothetical protein GCM10011572_50600 [Pseudoduganella buxea]